MLAELPGAGQRDPAEEGGLLHRRREVRLTIVRSLLFSVWWDASDAMFVSVCSNGCLSAGPQRAMGVGVQVLANGEGELRAALPLPGVLRPNIRR